MMDVKEWKYKAYIWEACSFVYKEYREYGEKKEAELSVS